MKCFASRIKHRNPAKVEPVYLDKGLERKATALRRGTDTEGVLQKKKFYTFLAGNQSTTRTTRN